METLEHKVIQQKGNASLIKTLKQQGWGRPLKKKGCDGKFYIELSRIKKT